MMAAAKKPAARKTAAKKPSEPVVKPAVLESKEPVVLETVAASVATIHDPGTTLGVKTIDPNVKDQGSTLGDVG